MIVLEPAMNITNDIQALTTFRNNSAAFLKTLKKTKRPMILTVNGKAAAVLQDAVAYQRLLDLAARADAREGIRQGLEQEKRGEGRNIEEFFAEFEKSRGIIRDV